MKKHLRHIIYLISALFNYNRKSKVLYYHDVGICYTKMGTPLILIKSQLNKVKHHEYEFVNQITKDSNQVMVCFDDGWAGIYDSKDFFIKENIFPIVFLVIDFIGKEGYLTKEKIKELQKAGFSFGCHTWSHRDLTKVPQEELYHEVVDSKKALEELLGNTVDSICFPKGRYSKDIYELCLSAGYERIFTSTIGCYRDNLDEKLICRNLIQDTPTLYIWSVLHGNPLVLKKHSKKQQFV